MKNLFRSLFSPILKPFESGTEPYIYKPSHRGILIFMGCLFSGLSIGVLWSAWGGDPGYFIPVVIFGGGGIVCLVIGLLGEERAVAKIWGSR